MTTTEAAPEIVAEDAGELRVRFPVLVIEGLSTSDGRFIEPGALSHRALPLSLLALPESSHGGADPGPSVLIGRLDTMTRTPGPEVMSPTTGEPFPEGTFVWSAEGVIDANHPVADMVRRRFLRGVSVDLVGMDYEIVGEEGFAGDPEFPDRELIVSKAQIGASTLVPLAAFADAYVELSGDTGPVEPTEAPPLELVASAFPAWRSVEVGDDVRLPGSLVASAGLPDDAVDQIRAVIEDDGGEQRDAAALAEAIVAHIQSWSEPVDESVEEEVPAMADAEAAPMDDLPVEPATGRPDEPQPDYYEPDKPATISLLFGDGQYVPVAADNEARAREDIAAEGFEVTDVVEIVQADTEDETAEEAV
jgi:hypothetical protein